MAPGLTTEIGGEFIDTRHHEMLRLVRMFDLPLIDVDQSSERMLVQHAYFVDGQQHSPQEVLEAFIAIVPAIQRDLRAVGDPNFRRHTRAAVVFDYMTLEEYFDGLGMEDWFRKGLGAAYLTEFGLDLERQSSINFITEVDPDVSDGVQILGAGAERFKVLGGNQQVADHLYAAVQDQVRLGHRLVALRERGSGFRLTFELDGGGTMEVDADIVVMTIPFTILRQVDLRVRMPNYKTRAIFGLGYGTNAKVFAGFLTRIWRAQGYTGYTFFLGGQAGIDIHSRGGSQDRGLSHAGPRWGLPGG